MYLNKEIYKNKCFVFYDSSCGVCDRFINIVAKIDTNDTLRFAPLNGENSKEVGIKLSSNSQKWSIIVLDNGLSYEKSDAILIILLKIPILSKVAVLLKLFPRPFRDMGYEVFARWRHLSSLNSKECRFDPLIKKKFLP
jgi:predicted DCC family thiol-disulfide oxidoreductase YuxK